MSKHKQTLEEIPLWDDLPITGDLAKDISIFLHADLACGPSGCGLNAAEPLLRRALKEIRSLRRQLLTKSQSKSVEGAEHG
jgi:hypothetical protein